MITCSLARRVEARETRTLCCWTVCYEGMQRRWKNFNHCLQTAVCKSRKLTCLFFPSLAYSLQFHLDSWGTMRGCLLSVVPHRRTILLRALFRPPSDVALAYSYPVLLFKIIPILPTTPLPPFKAPLASSDLKAGHRPSHSTLTAAHLALRSQEMRFSQLPAE